MGQNSRNILQEGVLKRNPLYFDDCYPVLFKHQYKHKNLVTNIIIQFACKTVTCSGPLQKYHEAVKYKLQKM